MNDKVLNHVDLAALFGELPADTDGEDLAQLEHRISHRVYKSTSCGAWAQLQEALPVGKRVQQEWDIDIRKYTKGYKCVRARMTSPDQGKWLPFKKWSKVLVQTVTRDDAPAGGYITDPELVEFLDGCDWDEKGRVDNFDVSFFGPTTDETTSGVTFGSIVEGIDAEVDPVTVAYPCTEADIWNALDDIEKGAEYLWNETHGCEHCWGGETIFNEWGEEAGPEDFGSRPVDPDCPECKGQGIVI